MLSKKMEKALNEQITRELFSAYLYLSMAAHFESVNLEGFSAWMKVQAQEEVTHAMKFFGYVHSRDGAVTLQAIDKPQASWKTPLAAFEAAYAHEQTISGHINDLVGVAGAEKDVATGIFLQWFVSEQVEEEATANGIVQKLKMIGDSPNGLFMLDRALGARGAEAD